MQVPWPDHSSQVADTQGPHIHVKGGGWNGHITIYFGLHQAVLVSCVLFAIHVCLCQAQCGYMPGYDDPDRGLLGNKCPLTRGGNVIMVACLETNVPICVGCVLVVC